MAFCHECGSEVSEGEAFCSICGIALRNPLVEDLRSEDTDDAPSQSAEPLPDQAPEPASETGAAAAESSAETDDTASDSDVESVPEDDFVDISALKSEESESEPEMEGSSSEESVSRDTSEQETPVIEEREATTPPEIAEPPAPGILADDAAEPQIREQAPESSGAASEVRPVDEVIQTPLGGEPAVSETSQGEGDANVSPSEPVSRETAPEEIRERFGESTEPPADVIAESREETPLESESATDVEDAAGSEAQIGAPEDRSVGDEEGFLEDATLIAMPVSKDEIAKAKAEFEEAQKKKTSAQEPAFEDVELASDSEPQSTEEPAQEQPPDKPDTEAETVIAANKPSEPSSPVQEAGQEQFPASDEDVAIHQASVSENIEDVEEGSEGPSTTPNIGVGDTDGSKAPKLQPLTEGTVLNSRYEVVRKIGGGGMGAVYLASDKNLGGVLRAVKEMVQSYIEEDQQEKAVQDFKRESMLLTSLEHPSIPTIYDYFFDEEAHRFYLVMKYISGGDLAVRLRSAPEGKLDEKEVTEWAIQIADVLDYLHNRQPPIVYRDLKPANIMLDGNSGKVMLIDFGIARWINKEEKGVTAVGTMGYAPPELFSGNVVPSSDIYSLGSTVFHLLTGADPQNNPLLIFDFEKNPKPRQINSRLSDQIESILMRAVEYKSENRFTTAAELRNALTEHLSNLNAGSVTYGKTETPKSVAFSDQNVFCGFCGQKIVATDMFCAFCGAKQPLAQPGVHSKDYVPVKLTAKLLIEGTSQLDYPSFDLAKDENLVGRRDPMSNIFPEVDLSKYDPQTKISRKHARIFRDGENYMVEDLGSSNGTLLLPGSNESIRLAPHQAQPLSHGDRIKLGDTMLHFVISA